MCARLCACTHAQRVHVYNKELWKEKGKEVF